MKKNVFYYAVRKGRKPGIYATWDECKSQIDKFSGAEYKKFSTEIEAFDFINQKPTKTISKTPQKKKVKKKKINDNDYKHLSRDFYKTLNIEKIYAFVDGSYNPKEKICGAGVIIVQNNTPITLCATLTDTPNTNMRNVYGEIKAAEIAFQWAVDNNIETILIYHDYEGIAKWCKEEWEAKNPRVKEYKKFYDECSKKVKIIFRHVRGHSGNMGNEDADLIAKEACGMAK